MRPAVGDHYFLSYARADQDFALRLARDLRGDDANIWVDQIDIQPSDRWDRAVEIAVRECIGLVLVLSPRSGQSDNVLDEISVALDAGKPVIPVLIEPCLPPLRLARVQFIDAVADYPGALARCGEAMRAARGGAPTARLSVAPASSSEPPVGPAVAPEIKARLSAALVRFMGPIAGRLVSDECRRGGALNEIVLRLADHIPSAKDRAAFLNAVRGP
jgi:hypothetical protein